ncbi:MAG: FtsQ-type POTRA domain-containing protein [Ruminococcus sp.]|nr:FtsQ-type POTRA domain-containing protein [Ruminococcus sp.]
MSDNRYDDDFSYQGLEKPDIMDKIGDSVSSVFSRRSRNNDKADDLLLEFSQNDDGDNYELFVDERVERKRVKKQQKQSAKKAKKEKAKKPVSPLVRRIRNIITSCVIVAVVLIVCVVLSLTVLFKTQNYEITGTTRYTQEEIIKTCGIGGNDNIFLANKKAAQKRLVNTYAYIEEADVSFAIPDTITIDITEAMPSYIVSVSESNYLIASSKGRILEQVESIKKYDLPLFLCSELKTYEVGGYIKYEDDKTSDIIDTIVTVFADNGYTGITEINSTNLADITFTYDDRIVVKLGLPEDISYKVRTAMTIIVEKLDLNGTQTTEGELDVSSCNTTKKSYFKEQSLIDSQIENPITDDPLSDDFTDLEDGEIEQEEETQAPLSPEDWYLD